MRNYYSPLLYIDSISAKVSTGTSGGYKYSGNDIEGYIPSRYHDRLTLNEFSTIANELNASGIPLAKYSLDSANMLRSDGDSSSGITMSNFSTIVDFENSLVKNTSFEIDIPGNTAKEKISQTEAVPITGLFGTDNFSASGFSSAAAYTTDNLNAPAGALLSSSEGTLSDDSSGLDNITAGIYMSKPSGTSSLPGIEFFLDFLKDNSHYGTYDSSGNIDPLSLAGSIYAGDLTARYTALGTLHISENSSAYGASLVSRINITQKRYTEAFAALYSRNDSTVSQNYYNADGGSLADAIRLTPVNADSEWPAYLNATATMDDSKTANNKFFDDNDTEVTLDVPSISVALSAPDGTATTEAQLYTMYNLDKTFDISTIQLPVGKKATWESSNYLTTNIDGKKPIYDILGASVELSLDNTNNTLKLDASYNVQLTQGANTQTAKFTTQVTNAIMDNIPTTFGSSSSHTANVRFIDAGGSPDLIVNLQLQGSYEGTVAHTGFTLTN